MQPLLLELERLAAFDDRSSLRDPRGRSASPSLIHIGHHALEVRGPFQLRRATIPTKARGIAFVAATGDPNPIHVDGDVVPGAWTASQMVGPLEVLIPRLAIDTFKVSFTGIAWYGRPLRTVATVTPGSDGHLAIAAQAFQDERLVGQGEATGRIVEPAPPTAVRSIDKTWLAHVESFFRSIGADPRAYFDKVGGLDASYPYAFLASLPSGTMVERLAGQGGILNRLTLDFDPEKLPISAPPEVSLELPSRLRSSFNKIVTRIKEGVLTAARGAALVLPRSSAPDELTQPPR